VGTFVTIMHILLYICLTPELSTVKMNAVFHGESATYRKCLVHFFRETPTSLRGTEISMDIYIKVK
jgi:hypothetical protein